MDNNQSSERVILVDHTGARHEGEAYDSNKALQIAEIDAAQRRNARGENPCLDWRNSVMGGIEREF